MELPREQAEIAGKILDEIRDRLRFLEEVGLEYLTLDRLSSTLSGGEAQRIQLATSLGSRLVGTLYVLDEPSIGLHTRDTNRLIKILKDLRDLGNTILVVEHDPGHHARQPTASSTSARGRARTAGDSSPTGTYRGDPAQPGFPHRTLPERRAAHRMAANAAPARRARIGFVSGRTATI